MKAYILVYSDLSGTRDQIKAWADSHDGIVHWRYDLPNTFYLISDLSAKDLAESFERSRGASTRFLIMETSENRQGRLPKETWHLLRHKKHLPKQNNVQQKTEGE
jgi:hypothetical protein